MKTAFAYNPVLTMEQEIESLLEQVSLSFAKLAPSWPLKNLIAVNPLQGFENLAIEDALKQGEAYFQQDDLPKEMEIINTQTIKWLQAYSDEGQATISMPFKELGLYASWRKLVIFDNQIHDANPRSIQWLESLPDTAIQTIRACLLWLEIPEKEYECFLTLLLTTLPGWAAYVKYRTQWQDVKENHLHSITQCDYLALRLVITCLVWPEAKSLLNWHQYAMTQTYRHVLKKIQEAETAYRLPLLKSLAAQRSEKSHAPEAQWVFCIDVRSEPFRKALETTGAYETFGFAGFFGIPTQITDSVTGETYASCPVLLRPKHEVIEFPCGDPACAHLAHKDYKRLTTLKRLYQSVKYTFTTPFALVESLGLLSGILMGLKTLFPYWAAKMQKTVLNSMQKPQKSQLSIDNISFEEQCAYAESVLRTMGLTDHFAPLIIFCGHGSTTQNNAYATALDCGACGGRNGCSNARILAAILNQPAVKLHLAQKGLVIPGDTRFIGAEHNTTTDEVSLYDVDDSLAISKIKENLLKARHANNVTRAAKMGRKLKPSRVMRHFGVRSQDWAQVRPEWGLAKNSAFIIGPRSLTAELDLEGRCFLHSYDYSKDPQHKFLTSILTAPMVVAQWINMQYLFSTLDNVAYGSGSKITKNITGKMGIMQGNASDLMTGLPLQSVYRSDNDPYHQLQRLMTVVFAPREMLDTIIWEQAVLKKLFGNGWVQLVVIEPDTRRVYQLNRNFSWQALK